jgi:hypothetical protein
MNIRNFGHLQKQGLQESVKTQARLQGSYGVNRKQKAANARDSDEENLNGGGNRFSHQSRR